MARKKCPHCRITVLFREGSLMDRDVNAGVLGRDSAQSLGTKLRRQNIGKTVDESYPRVPEFNKVLGRGRHPHLVSALNM
jgi:hypothetical protein